MANCRCNCLFFLVIILILSHEILLFTEGRSLSLGLKTNFEINVNLLSPDEKSITAKAAGKNVAIGSPFYRVFRSLEEYVAAFRPTTPGHSPGVCHSIHH
ncbi:hypothetical protein DITRI_Ditri18aG0093600 [Diplodiscus trichospermus]